MRREDAHHFGLWQVHTLIHHQQVNQVIKVGQMLTLPEFYGHPAVGVPFGQVATRPLDVPGVGIQPVHQVTIAGTESRRQLTVAAAHMDDQAALHARGGKDFLRSFLARSGVCR